MRDLILILGDQLDPACVLPASYDPTRDVLWMAESHQEARRVWSHKARIVLFFSAMRHFRDDLISDGHPLIYRQSTGSGITQLLEEDIRKDRPKRIVLTRPGDYRLHAEICEIARRHQIDLHLREDRHFFTTPEQFADWADGRKQLRMEFFYRQLRQQTGYLMEPSGTQPLGGRWNFDAENRKSFGRQGPDHMRPPQAFGPDAITRQVIEQVEEHFADHPGDLARFDWPVTPAEARQALTDFVSYRLASFGDFQDAMWQGETWLFHSRLSAALNLHLLNPRDVIAAATSAFEEGDAPLPAVEGFVRQILGWREFVRGLYWLRMPHWESENFFSADQDLPSWYWTGDTDMACLKDALRSTLDTGYAHHIQRLMVTGLYSLLLGVEPRQIEAWYHAIYVDAVQWAELPNTLGMSQFVDGGVLASKPYLASGAYINRMSNACQHCPYSPRQRHGELACPFTVLYWDFLIRHEQLLRPQHRLKMQLRNLERLSAAERQDIRTQAQYIRSARR